MFHVRVEGEASASRSPRRRVHFPSPSHRLPSAQQPRPRGAPAPPWSRVLAFPLRTPARGAGERTTTLPRGADRGAPQRPGASPASPAALDPATPSARSQSPALSGARGLEAAATGPGARARAGAAHARGVRGAGGARRERAAASGAGRRRDWRRGWLRWATQSALPGVPLQARDG